MIGTLNGIQLSKVRILKFWGASGLTKTPSFNIRHLLVTVFCFVFFCLPGYAGEQMRFVNITPDKGLSNPNIISIIQDHEGYMWIGTAEGLNRYDGLKFVTYKSVNSDTTTLSGNYITTLLEDKSNRLWVGTDNGLCCYNRDYNNFERITYPDENKQPFTRKVNSIIEDKSNQLWVGTNSGVAVLDFEKKEFIPQLKRIVGNKEVSVLSLDDEGNILLAGVGFGLVKYNPQSGKTTAYNTQHPSCPLLENNIYGLASDPKGRIWVGYISKGVSVIDEKAQTITHYQHDNENSNSLAGNYIITLTAHPDGRIMIGTNGDGLSVFDPESNSFRNYRATNESNSLMGNSVYKIYIAPDGMIWIGCWGSGLSIFDKRFFKFTSYVYNRQNPNSPVGESVTSFAEDGAGNIWIATDGGGIDCFDVKSQKFFNHKKSDNDPNSLTNNKVLSVVTDNNGGLWAGMWNGGVNYFKIDGHQLKLIKRFNKLDKSDQNNTSVFKLYFDPARRLWVGAFEDNIYTYNDSADVFWPLNKLIDIENDTLSRLTVNDIYYGSKGNHWFSTQDFGLLKVNLNHNNHHLYRQNTDSPDGQPAKLISFVHEDQQKRLWVGTNVGLSLFDREAETFKTYTREDGLPSGNIVGMLEDSHGNLWVSSNKGLSKLTPGGQTNDSKLAIRNYVKSDGLQGDIFNRWAYFKSSAGKMYFGGINGFTAFYPDSISDNTDIPPIQFTDFLLFNEPVGIGEKDSILKKQLSQTEEIVLKHDQNYFTIRFVALNFVMSEKNQYAYILEGLDKDWNYVRNRNEANYTHVRPGHYTFRVKACNNDGYWNDEGASIKITIMPPWWQSKLFKTLVIILIIVGTVFIVIKMIEYFRSLANQTILNERNQLQTLIDNIPDQVFIKDKHSRFVVVNIRTSQKLGQYSPHDIIHKTDYDFFKPDQASALVKQELKIMETGNPVINEESKSVEDGVVYFWSTTKCPIVNPKGETLGIVSIIRNITAEKQADMQIKQQSLELQKINKHLTDANKHLEAQQDMIEQQAEELYQQKEELLRSNKQLNKLIATKDKLFSIIAHDVKNPFNIIMGFSELLLHNMDNWDDAEKRNTAQIIYQSSSELSFMLENLLQWARDQRGLVKCHPRDINIEPFVQNIISFFKQNLLLKNIKIKTNFDFAHLQVKADPQLLDTIFRNLIGNAIKFTNTGGQITVGAETRKNKVVLSISDTGVGIDPDKIKTLFNVGEHETTAGTNDERGTGLGLIVVKEFIEKQGGTIWVESTVGKGSSFYFTLPVTSGKSN
ncbi:MAG: PAS domain-containing protein [Prolixibacteraceae bacterium]|nr:PAS domain-containing protein [Prolixibacteraceae bacterium]